MERPSDSSGPCSACFAFFAFHLSFCDILRFTWDDLYTCFQPPSLFNQRISWQLYITYRVYLPYHRTKRSVEKGERVVIVSFVLCSRSAVAVGVVRWVASAGHAAHRYSFTDVLEESTVRLGNWNKNDQQRFKMSSQGYYGQQPQYPPQRCVYLLVLRMSRRCYCGFRPTLGDRMRTELTEAWMMMNITDVCWSIQLYRGVLSTSTGLPTSGLSTTAGLWGTTTGTSSTTTSRFRPFQRDNGS